MLKNNKDEISSKLLSVCIPVYNRMYVFKWCLISACEACVGYEDIVEIIVSDNASTDNIKSIVTKVSDMYPTIDIIYNCNDENLGFAKNVFRLTDMASGEFCWTIGSDDFIKKNSIESIISILKYNNDIDFISCSFDLMKIDGKIIDNEVEIDGIISNQLKHGTIIEPNGAPKESFKVDKLDYIIDPTYNNVLLGALMTGIFRLRIWKEVDIKEEKLEGYDSILNIYPHVYVYANAFLGRKAYYCGNPLITVGEGVREWSIDTKSYWESSLPIIYFKVFAEIIKCYKENGIEYEYYIKCENWAAGFAGGLLVPLVWKKYVTKENVNGIEKISPLETSSIYIDSEVYKQTALNSLNIEYNTMLNQYNNMEKSFMGNIVIDMFRSVLENYSYVSRGELRK